jgi:hypothetical protein
MTQSIVDGFPRLSSHTPISYGKYSGGFWYNESRFLYLPVSIDCGFSLTLIPSADFRDFASVREIVDFTSAR